jgi:hypothetical protein
MAEVSYIIIISIFLLYYLFVLIFERKFITEPRQILEKFLAVVLIYAGISLIYFSITGEALFNESADHSVYIFIMGFIAVLWSVPNLLSEFWFFRKFMEGRKKLERSRKRKRSY